MNKLNAMAAIMKFINGKNDSPEQLRDMYEYITDPAKTDDGRLIATHGCSTEYPINDMLLNKMLHNKMTGKQGVHFIVAFAPQYTDGFYILNTVSDIVSNVYPKNMSVTAVHTDSKCLHAHVLLDSVNAVTGKKFSQGPSDLNRVKQKANNILRKYGFDIITNSTNEFVDSNDYSDVKGFDFLELDESVFITKEDLSNINPYEAPVIAEDTIGTSSCWDSSCSFTNNFYGGYNTMNSNYNAYESQTGNINSQEIETVPETEIVPTIEEVPTTMNNPVNAYPNTNVVTGPTFSIKGTPQSNLEGLGELVTQTAAHSYKHQIEAAKLAYGMQKRAQEQGIYTNVSIVAGPVFKIDMTGTLSNTYSCDDDDCCGV